MNASAQSSPLFAPRVLVPFSALVGLICTVVATMLLILGANWTLDTGIELYDSLFLVTPMYMYWALQWMYKKGREDALQSE